MIFFMNNNYQFVQVNNFNDFEYVLNDHYKKGWELVSHSVFQENTGVIRYTAVLFKK